MAAEGDGGGTDAVLTALDGDGAAVKGYAAGGGDAVSSGGEVGSAAGIALDKDVDVAVRDSDGIAAAADGERGIVAEDDVGTLVLEGEPAADGDAAADDIPCLGIPAVAIAHVAAIACDEREAVSGDTGILAVGIDVRHGNVVARTQRLAGDGTALRVGQRTAVGIGAVGQ